MRTLESLHFDPGFLRRFAFRGLGETAVASSANFSALFEAAAVLSLLLPSAVGRSACQFDGINTEPSGCTTRSQKDFAMSLINADLEVLSFSATAWSRASVSESSLIGS